MMASEAEGLCMESSSIKLFKHSSRIVHQGLVEVVRSVFEKEESEYLTMDMYQYRELMFQAQSIMNADHINNKILASILPGIEVYLDTSNLLIQGNVYLRASRPQQPSEQENIGWHRESFYGPNLQKSVNIWTPIQGVDRKNTLRFIPYSQHIADEDIKTINQGVKSTERYSTGHKLGFNYDPKKIVSGADLTAGKPMLVPTGMSAAFSGALLHGAAVNRSDKIRFSVDFQVIRKRDFSNSNKKYHFSSGKEYFVEPDLTV